MGTSTELTQIERMIVKWNLFTRILWRTICFNFTESTEMGIPENKDPGPWRTLDDPGPTAMSLHRLKNTDS